MDQFHGGPIHAQTQANPSTLVNYGVIVGTNGDRIINEAKTYVEMAKELPVITRNNLAYIVIDKCGAGKRYGGHASGPLSCEESAGLSGRHLR